MANPIKVSRQVSLKIVMQMIAKDGPISRASIAKQAELSKQTVSEVVKQLEDRDWVRVTGQTKGHIGRTAITYEINPNSSGIIVVDLGGTKVRAVVVNFVGNVTSDLTELTDPRGKNSVTDQIVRMCKTVVQQSSIDDSQINLAVVGVPGVPNLSDGTVGMASNIDGLDLINVRELISAPLGIDVILENDVNLAVLGEQWLGEEGEVGLDNLVFISLGTGIGAGIVINGQIVRGINGAAGELAFLPFGSDPTSDSALRSGALEGAIGTKAIMKLYQDKVGESQSVKEIFNRARNGEPEANEVVSDIAFGTARTITAICALINPGRIMMGGSIGSQDILIDLINNHISKFMNNAPVIVVSTLDGDAPLIGGIAIGLEQHHSVLFNVDTGAEEGTQIPAPKRSDFLGTLN